MKKLSELRGVKMLTQTQQKGIKGGADPLTCPQQCIVTNCAMYVFTPGPGGDICEGLCNWSCNQGDGKPKNTGALLLSIITLPVTT